MHPKLSLVLVGAPRMIRGGPQLLPKYSFDIYLFHIFRQSRKHNNNCEHVAKNYNLDPLGSLGCGIPGDPGSCGSQGYPAPPMASCFLQIPRVLWELILGRAAGPSLCACVSGSMTCLSCAPGVAMGRVVTENDGLARVLLVHLWEKTNQLSFQDRLLRFSAFQFSICSFC